MMVSSVADVGASGTEQRAGSSGRGTTVGPGATGATDGGGAGGVELIVLQLVEGLAVEAQPLRQPLFLHGALLSGITAWLRRDRAHFRAGRAEVSTIRPRCAESGPDFQTIRPEVWAVRTDLQTIGTEDWMIRTSLGVIQTKLWVIRAEV
jgi:hypothetical protein